MIGMNSWILGMKLTLIPNKDERIMISSKHTEEF